MRKLGVEYHGFFYHREERVGKRYHLIKAELALEENVRLIQIFENEWKNKKDIVKSKIDNLLGINSKIYARKTQVIGLSFGDSNIFVDENHLQGSGRSSVRLGLVYNNDLVACMTFGKPRFNSHYDWELIRYCSKQHVNIVGGASKLFKYFNRHYEGKIITYADRRWSNGDLYNKLGFKSNGCSSPGYLYYNASNHTIKSRLSCQKHKLKDMIEYDEELSESQIMSMAGYCKVWDAGNFVFEYQIQST